MHGEAAPDRLPRIDRAVAALDGGRSRAAERPAADHRGRALYIYTSGTTGMPKAANINHYRLMLAGLRLRRRDGHARRPTACMTACRCITPPAAWWRPARCWSPAARSSSARSSRRANSGTTWSRHDCTLFQYIGELCRYLVQRRRIRDETRAPAAARLRQRAAARHLAATSRRRFRIPRILEFYAATEGNVTLFNFDGKPGAVGRMPWFLDASVSDRDRPVRRRDASSRCAMRGDSASGARPARSAKRSARSSTIRRSRAAGSRAMPTQAENEQQDPARRVRAGRRLVPHRRPDAPGRGRLFLFRRPHRRHLPLEGRERVDHGGRPRRSTAFPASSDANVYGVRGPGPRGPRRHGGDRVRRRSRSRRAARASARAAARLCAAVVPAHLRRRSRSPRRSSRRSSTWSSQGSIPAAAPMRSTSTIRAAAPTSARRRRSYRAHSLRRQR